MRSSEPGCVAKGTGLSTLGGTGPPWGLYGWAALSPVRESEHKQGFQGALCSIAWLSQRQR